MDDQRNHCTSGTHYSESQNKNTHLSDSSKERVKNFIPNQIAPDNWPFFEALSNPLCSKGISGTDEDFYDK